MYACPNCGGNFKFHIPTQQLRCEYCETTEDPYAADDKAKNLKENNQYEVTVFTCPQCGGEILSTDTSAAEFCSFCGASTILHTRMQNEKRPSYIIPFQKTKEDCKKAYGQMMKRAIFAPTELKDPKHIDGFRGIYMPYWAFEITQNNSYALEGKRTHRQGDYIITDHYRLTGDIDAHYDGLAYDASSSFDDNISEKLAPYNTTKMQEFTPAFLSGFYADIADVDANQYRYDAEGVANQNSAREIHNQSEYFGYAISGNLDSADLNTKTKEIHNAMFPVWFLSYRHAGRVAYATVNGQTGKVVTDIPIDGKKYLLSSLALAVPLFLILNLFFTILPSHLVILTTILAVVSLIIYFCELGAIRAKEKPDKKRFDAGLFTGLLAVAAGILVLVLQPIHDWYYYTAAVFTIVATFATIKDIIYYYNIMSTHKPPQFLRTGGDDNA